MMTPDQHAKAREMWEAGRTAGQIAQRLGVTRNAIIGLANRGKWPPHGEAQQWLTGPEPTTLFERLDALHAKFDAVVKAIGTVPRVPNVVKAR